MIMSYLYYAYYALNRSFFIRILTNYQIRKNTNIVYTHSWVKDPE